jgi:hypothetical protein
MSDGEATASPEAATETEQAADSDDEYSGLFGAFPYAFRHSKSRLFKIYAAIGGLAAAFIALQFIISLLVVVSNTLGAGGGTFTFARSFVIVVGALVLAPVLAPILYVARRARLQAVSHERYDFVMGLLGFGFLLALYVGIVIAMPESFEFGDTTTTRPEPSGLFAPVIRVLYGLPQLVGILPPTLVSVSIPVVDRYLR